MDGANFIRRALIGQAEALEALAEDVDAEALARAVAAIAGASLVIVAGTGKSGHVARRAASSFAALGKPAFFMCPNEARHGDSGALAGGACLIAITHSGTCRYLAWMLDRVLDRDGVGVVITSRLDGETVARRRVIPVAYRRSPEIFGRLPSTSAMIQGALCDVLAGMYGVQHSDVTKFEANHPGGDIGRTR